MIAHGSLLTCRERCSSGFSGEDCSCFGWRPALSCRRRLAITIYEKNTFGGVLCVGVPLWRRQGAGGGGCRAYGAVPGVHDECPGAHHAEGAGREPIRGPAENGR